MDISSTDPPHGGKGCLGGMLLHNPAPKEGWLGDKHSWTMKPSFTPYRIHTHLKSTYPQCNIWLK